MGCFAYASEVDIAELEMGVYTSASQKALHMSCECPCRWSESFVLKYEISHVPSGSTFKESWLEQE